MLPIDSNIIYMDEFYPLINPQTIPFNLRALEQLQWFRNLAQEALAQCDGNVIRWNSHLLANFDYFKICSRNLTYGVAQQAKLGCSDMWHPNAGLWDAAMVPQLLNTICND